MTDVGRRSGRGCLRLAALGSLAAFAGLGGCASHYLPVDDGGHVTAAKPSVGAPATMPANTPDTCGAGKLQYLVGKRWTQVPVPADLNSQRVSCTTCVRSDDVNPRRVTVLYDQPSGLVTKVICQ